MMVRNEVICNACNTVLHTYAVSRKVFIADILQCILDGFAYRLTLPVARGCDLATLRLPEPTVNLSGISDRKEMGSQKKLW